MRTIRLWQGVRMRQVAASADPDAPPRPVTIPAAWEDRAADGLAALSPGEGPVSIAGASGVWLGVLGERARRAGSPELPLRLHALLRRRRAAPVARIWRGEPGPPGWRVNLAAFHEPGTGFDVAGFAEAATDIATACRLLAAEPGPCEIGLSGLDDLLAALGLDYASPAARDVACCLAALLRGRATVALESQGDLLAGGADWPEPPACAVPGLTEAARAARGASRVTPGAPPATGIAAPDEVDALLGIETAGIAPAFAAVAEGRLSRAALDRLASAGRSPEAALAASLSGENPLPAATHAAHRAMHEALALYLPVMPTLPEALPAPGAGPAPRRAAARTLPYHAAGLAQKVTVGGHRVLLRTGEHEDGSLGEITIALPKEGATTRALIECLAQAVSIGLQHGVPLDPFVEAFAATDFSPAGRVEGDPAVSQASSVLDYVFRTLAVNYLGRRLPEPAPETETDLALLPLELPPRMRRRSLRIVG